VKLFTFGCSITADTSWTSYIAECLNIEYKNLAVGSSSNQLQLKRMQEYILNDMIDSNDLVIWQLTCTERPHTRVTYTDINIREAERDSKDYEYPAYITDSVNIFSGYKKIDLLSHSNIKYEIRPKEDDILEDIAFSLISLKRLVPNLLIIFGWEKCIPKEYQEKFKSILKKHNVDYLDEYMVEWCHENNLKFCGDTMHPSSGSMCQFTKTHTLPRISEMLSIGYIEPLPNWAE
jgi:hypothetical protein